MPMTPKELRDQARRLQLAAQKMFETADLLDGRVSLSKNGETDTSVSKNGAKHLKKKEGPKAKIRDLLSKEPMARADILTALPAISPSHISATLSRNKEFESKEGKWHLVS